MKIHTRKKFKAAGIKDGSKVFLLNECRGGGGKRSKVDEEADEDFTPLLFVPEVAEGDLPIFKDLNKLNCLVFNQTLDYGF